MSEGGKPKRFDILARFYDEKAWVFMHDPLAKAYFIHTPGKHHVREARQAFSNIWVEVNVNELLKKDDEDEQFKKDIRPIIKADILGSMLDRRWSGVFHSRVIEPFRQVRADDFRLVINIFDPDKKKHLSRPYNDQSFEEIHNEVVESLNNLLNIEEFLKAKTNICVEDSHQVTDVIRKIIRYHLLYFYAEPIWIAKGGEPLPADTRVPNHTIFDHLSAVASVYNLITRVGGSDGQGGGYLVRIDLGGIQQFISFSRKVRDLWASSYILSMMVWAAIKPLIFVFGPDIVLVPTMRLNPVYHHQLHIWIRDIYGDEFLKNRVNSLDERVWTDVFLTLYKGELTHVYESSEAPPYALIPAIITLALPPPSVLREGLELLLEISGCEDISCDDDSGGEPRGAGILSRSMVKVIREKLDELKESKGSAGPEFVENLISSLVEVVWKDVYEDVMNLCTGGSKNDGIVGLLKSYLAKLIMPNNPQVDVDLSSFRKEELTLIHDYIRSVKDAPPVIIRVGAAKLDKNLRKIVDMATNKGGDSRAHAVAQSILELMNDSISMRLENNHLVRDTPFAYKDLSNITEEIFSRRRKGDNIGLGVVVKRVDANNNKIEVEPNRGRGYDYCTMCSILPAIIHYHREVKHDSPYISRGEKLCPVCLFKRLIGVDAESLKKFVRIVFSLKGENPPRLEVLSTIDVANRYLGEEISKILKEYQQLTNTGSTSDIDVLLSKFTKCSNRDWICENVQQASGRPVSFEEIDMPLGIVTRGEEEFDEEMYKKVKNAWETLFRERLGIDFPNGITIYYGIFITDADRIGKIVSGELFRARPFKKRDPELYGYEDEVRFYIDYIRKSLNIGDAGARRFFNTLLCSVENVLLSLRPWDKENRNLGITYAKDCVIRRLIARGAIPKEKQEDESYMREIEKLVYSILIFFYRPVIRRDVNNGFKIGFIYRPRVVPSPSYLVSISRSLMTSLLRDVYNVEKSKGIVIYAGGDDLLALLPLVKLDFKKIENDDNHNNSKEKMMVCMKENFLETMENVRSFYSLGDEEGFAIVKSSRDNGVGVEYPVPMLYGLGRSQVLLMAHYREPMSKAIQLAHELLDKVAKDESRWRLECSEGAIYERDGLVITSYSGGVIRAPTSPVLPCMLISGCSYEPIHKYLRSLYNYIYGDKIISKEVAEEGECKRNLLSHSFLRDYLQDMDLMGLSGKLNPEIPRKTIVRIIGRNLRIRGMEEANGALNLAQEIYREIFNILRCIYHSDRLLEELMLEQMMITGEYVEYEFTASEMAVSMLLKMSVATRGVGQ